MDSVLEIRDLSVSYYREKGRQHPALEGVSFDIKRGEVLGVLGESGSGKSTLAAAILRLLADDCCALQGSVTFDGLDLLRCHYRTLAGIRGGRISLIFQEPSAALHPTMRAGDQIQEILRAHGLGSAAARKQRALRALNLVFPSGAERVFSAYPHELSGGQRQRVLIAQAIVCEPSLVIADEPTASLDPTTQREVLVLFEELRRQLGLAILWITHNPALLAGFANRVLVLYAGRVVEVGPSFAVLLSPKHPYTERLLRSAPSLCDSDEGDGPKTLPVIAGESPNLSVPAPGCRFEPRCLERMEMCAKREPPLVPLNRAHLVSCLKYGG
jgi:oligopeptide/dipeptide ABC transporter ATP-binding protein